MRWLTNGVIVAWLVLQVGLPLSWYLTGGGPDERFAWRMFSTQRLTKCSVALVETHSSPDGSERKENPDLNPLLQRSWITLLTRGQPEVTDTFLASRCEATDATTVALRRRCVTPSGEKLPMQWTRRSCGEKP